MTRILTIILLIILMILAAAFAIINATPIELNYFVGHIYAPLALVLILSFIVGSLVAILFSMPGKMRLRHENNRLHKEIAMMKAEKQMRLKHMQDS